MLGENSAICVVCIGHYGFKVSRRCSHWCVNIAANGRKLVTRNLMYGAPKGACDFISPLLLQKGLLPGRHSEEGVTDQKMQGRSN